MATVYLHIGAPKTATSTLQGVFAKNYRELLKHGVLYPRDCRSGDAHHLLVCDLIEKHHGKPMPDVWYGSLPRGEAWASLVAELKRHESQVDSVVLSSELFFGQAKSIGLMLDDIRHHLQGHEIKVVVYLRRQDQLYSSFYNQDVKGVRQWTGSAYEFYETHQIFQNDYHSLLDIWSTAFGKHNVIIRPFESGQWLEGDIIRDFCAATGTVPLSSNFREENESLGPNQLSVKRAINTVGYDKGRNEEVVKALMAICPESPAEGYAYVNRELYRKYRERWLRVNRALAEEYLGQPELFVHSIPAPAQVRVHAFDRLGVAYCIQEISKSITRGEHPQVGQLFARAMFSLMAQQDLWEAVDADTRASLFALAEP